VCQIKFSHDYPKLHGQTRGKLIFISKISKNDFPLNDELLEYDTKTSDGEYYPLPKTDYLQLIFLGNKGIPFCTIRRFTPDKFNYYSNKVGEYFEVSIEKVEQ